MIIRVLNSGTDVHNLAFHTPHKAAYILGPALVGIAVEQVVVGMIKGDLIKYGVHMLTRGRPAQCQTPVCIGGNLYFNVLVKSADIPFTLRRTRGAWNKD